MVIRTGSAYLSEVVTYPSVILRLPHGGDVRIDNLNLATRCGVSLSHFGNLSGSAGVPAPGSAATLDALVELSELDLVPPRAARTLYYQSSSRT